MQDLKTERDDDGSHVDRWLVDGNAGATDFRPPCNSMVSIRNMQLLAYRWGFQFEMAALIAPWICHGIISGEPGNSSVRIEIAALLYNAYIRR